jgi:antitoxin component YwqK of YwqJK toxin-antitoxin module
MPIFKESKDFSRELFYEEGQLICDSNQNNLFKEEKVKVTSRLLKGLFEPKNNGTYEIFYDNGLPFGIENYKDGKKHGKCEYFNEDGSKWYSIEFFNGERDGSFISYESNKIAEEKYYRNGKETSSKMKGNSKIKEGNVKLYYSSDNKNIYASLNYKNDILNGPCIYYYIDGTIKGKGTYKNGLLEGEALNYFPNGNLEKITTYKNGLKHGYEKIPRL